jgi:hypothetical protein
MPRTIRVYYSKSHGLKGRCRMNYNWPPITQQSVVLISAAEATNLTPSVAPPPNFGFVLGSADVYVTNISPHAGGVEFILHVSWHEPLNIVVDICVFDPPEQFHVA